MPLQFSETYLRLSDGLSKTAYAIQRIQQEKSTDQGRNPECRTDSKSPESRAKIRDDMKGPFKIRLSRIETVSANEPGDFAQVTFRILSEARGFDFPILVNMNEFDEADLTKVARSILHEKLVELASETEKWKISEDELKQLSSWKFYPGA